MEIVYTDDKQYLAHHGIKGQKWGVRRYQNPDGTLTEAGIARYGSKKKQSLNDGKIIREVSKSSLFGARHLRSMRNTRLENKISQKKESEKNTEKLEKKLNAQKLSNDNRKAYEDYTSTGKMIAQNLLLTHFGADRYRSARARGEKRIRSLLETSVGPIGQILRLRGDQKAYGSFAWSDTSEGLYHGQ